MSAHIIGEDSSGAVDLGSLSGKSAAVEWINHPANKEMKDFISDMKGYLEENEDRLGSKAYDARSTLSFYIAGFLTGMTLIQNIFLGSQALVMANDIVNELYSEDVDSADEEKPEEKEKTEVKEDSGEEVQNT